MQTDTFDPNDWIHLAALARLLGVSRSTMSARLQREGAPSVLRVGRRVYIRRDEIDNPQLRLS